MSFSLQLWSMICFCSLVIILPQTVYWPIYHICMWQSSEGPKFILKEGACLDGRIETSHNTNYCWQTFPLAQIREFRITGLELEKQALRVLINCSLKSHWYWLYRNRNWIKAIESVIFMSRTWTHSQRKRPMLSYPSVFCSEVFKQNPLIAMFIVIRFLFMRVSNANFHWTS